MAAFAFLFSLIAALVWFALHTPDRTRIAYAPPPHASAAVQTAETGGKGPEGPDLSPNWFPRSCAAQPPEQYAMIVLSAARRHGIDPCLIARQTKAESNWNPKARSPAGAIGISQFLPATAREWHIDPLDPDQSINAQAAYVAWLRRRFDPSMRSEQDVNRLAVASYNFGLGNMRKSQSHHGWRTYAEAEPHLPAETTGYVRKVFD